MLINHLEKMDTEFDNYILKTKALKIDGNGIKKDMKLNVPSFDYIFYNKNCVFFIEFSDIEEQLKSLTQINSDKKIQKFLESFIDEIDYFIKVNSSNKYEKIKNKIIINEFKGKILGTICIFTHLSKKFIIKNNEFFNRNKRVIIVPKIESQNIMVLEQIRELLELNLKNLFTNLFDELKIIPYNYLDEYLKQCQD